MDSPHQSGHNFVPIEDILIRFFIFIKLIDSPNDDNEKE